MISSMSNVSDQNLCEIQRYKPWVRFCSESVDEEKKEGEFDMGRVMGFLCTQMRGNEEPLIS